MSTSGREVTQACGAEQRSGPASSRAALFRLKDIAPEVPLPGTVSSTRHFLLLLLLLSESEAQGASDPGAA